MLEILQFYVSGFWTWAGITVGLALIGRLIVAAFAVLVAGITGRQVNIDT